MIRLINTIGGHFIRFISFVTWKINPSLRLQFALIRQVVSESLIVSENLPGALTTAIIMCEDRRFFEHNGVDIYSISRAIVRNSTSKRLEGASTITQQLVRSITNEREIRALRKIKEIILAILLDQEFSKREILLAYLHNYKFRDCTGVFSFCKKDNYNIENLSLNQIAEIVARFKYPFLTKINYSRYLKRVRAIEIRAATTLKNF